MSYTRIWNEYNNPSSKAELTTGREVLLLSGGYKYK